jgi:hypothetical protein
MCCWVVASTGASLSSLSVFMGDSHYSQVMPYMCVFPASGGTRALLLIITNESSFFVDFPWSKNHSRIWQWSRKEWRLWTLILCAIFAFFHFSRLPPEHSGKLWLVGTMMSDGSLCSPGLEYKPKDTVTSVVHRTAPGSSRGPVLLECVNVEDAI